MAPTGATDEDELRAAKMANRFDIRRIIGGLFCVFSYITPTMTQVAGLPDRMMPAVLAVFGVGMISGNLIGAKLADRALMPTIAGALVWNIAVMGLFTFTAHPAFFCDDH